MTFAHRLGLLAPEVLASRTGASTLRCGARFILSAYDPEREAARRADETAGARVHLVGLGLGYLAEALGERCVGVLGFEGERERLEQVRPAARGPIEKTVFHRTEADFARGLEEAFLTGAAVVLDMSLRAAPRLWAALREYLVERRFRRVAFVGDETRNDSEPRPVAPQLVSAALKHQTTRGLGEFGEVAVEMTRFPSAPRRILVIQPSSIGDVLYITPALSALREKYPDSWIGYVVEEEAAEILMSGVPDELFVARRREWMAEDDVIAPACMARFLDRLACARADLILNPHSAARSAWYAAAAALGGGCVVGLVFDAEGRLSLRGGPHHLRFNRTVDENGHERALLEAPVGVPWLLNESGRLARMTGLGRAECRIRFSPSDEDRAAAARRLEKVGVARPFIAIHTGSNDPKRRYRRAEWPRVAEGIFDRWKHDVVWIGGRADSERNAWIRERTGVETFDLTAGGGLGFTTAILERAAMLIGPETSTVHLAAAVDRPSLTITWPRWVAAFAARSLVIHGPDDPPWCGLLPPEVIVVAAGFALGLGPMPVLPPGLLSSWTGEKRPNEYLRELDPVRRRRGGEYSSVVLAFAYERICDAVAASWGYAADSVSPTAAREWLGECDDEARAAIEEWAEELRVIERSESLPGSREIFWSEFFKSLSLCPLPVSSRASAARAAREFMIAVIS